MRIRIKMPTKRNLILYIAALCVVGVFVAFALHEEKKDLQYDIVVLGDSIIGNAGTDGLALTDYLEERLHKSVYKGGIGGTSMSVPSKHMWGSASNAEWSMVKLAEAICYNDWKSQLTTISYAKSYSDINNQALSYFPETMEGLSGIDFSKVEILVIEHGTNDYSSGRRVDNTEDPYDVTTFGGALRQSLKIIKKQYPDMRIIVMSPIYCSLGEEQAKACYNTKYDEGGYLDDYVEVGKQIAKEFGVEWIDAYHGSGIWEDNADVYLEDNLHLNTEGHKKMGHFLADYLEANNS